MFPNIVMETLAPGFQDLNDRFSQLGRQIQQAGRLDVDTGSVTVDEAQVRDAFVQALGDDQGQSSGEDYVNLLRAGFAVLAVPESADQPPVVFPWGLLMEPKPSWPEVVTPMLLSELGIGLGGTPNAARNVMTRRFPNVPAAVIEETNLEYLGQVALLELLRDTEAMGGPIIEIAEKMKWNIKTGGGPTDPGAATGNPVMDAVNQALACFQNTTINAYIWGMEACWDNRCAGLIGNALLGAGAPQMMAALKALFGSMFAGATLAAASKAAIAAGGGVVAVILAASALYTGSSLLRENTSQGCCLQALWPAFGNAIWWAAGR